MYRGQDRNDDRSCHHNPKLEWARGHNRVPQTGTCPNYEVIVVVKSKIKDIILNGEGKLARLL